MSKYYKTKYSTANNSTDAYNVGWDIEKYRDIHECEEHWQLRKAFMEKWKNNFPEERLVCLARVYTNIEFMGCRYPAPVMEQIAALSFEDGQKYKDKKKTKLQRTFVSASTAAEDRARGIKRVGGEIVTDDTPKSSRIAFVAQGQTPAPVEVDSDEEGMILLNRGAFSTFIAPGGPIANALCSSGVDTGMILAEIAAETRTQSFWKQMVLEPIRAFNDPFFHTQTQTAAIGYNGVMFPLTHLPSSTAMYNKNPFNTTNTHIDTKSTHTHTTTTITNTPNVHTHTGAKAKAKTPKRGAPSTSSVPRCSAANASCSSAVTGLAAANTAAKTNKSLNKGRTSALLGTSSGPSPLLGAQSTTVNAGGRALLPHPPPPIAPLVAPRPLAVTGQSVEICITDDVFTRNWEVQKGGNAPASRRHQAALAPLASVARKRYRPTKKQRLAAQGKGKSRQLTLADAAGQGQPTSGKVNFFSAGKRSQAEADNSRPGPSRSPAGTVEGPATAASQRPVRNDQAAAKRALNETSSPQGERERPRLDKSKRVANRSYAQAAGSDLDVAVTCGQTGQINKEVADQILEALQRKMLAEACSPDAEHLPVPVFNARPTFADGVLKLWCDSEVTLSWLNKLIAEMPSLAGTTLVIKKQADLKRRIRCGILIPDDLGVFTDPFNIGRLLYHQNRWIDIRRWALLQAKRQENACFVVVGIPEDHIPTLMDAERRLSFCAGRVYVMFQTPNGKFVNVPQGYPASEATTSGVTRLEEATPCTSSMELPAVLPAGAELEAPAVVGVETVLSSGGELDDDILSSATDLEEGGFDTGFLFAGLRLEGELAPTKHWENRGQIKERVSYQTNSLLDSCHAPCPETTPPTKPARQPWWGADLERERATVRKALNRAMNTGADKDWDVYRAAKSNYKKIIRFRSSAAWKNISGKIESKQIG